MNILAALIAGIIGVLVGGIVNALADDLPRRVNPQRPHYPDGAARPPAAWLGVTAFLTRQRSSPEGAKLSWRHPVVEIGIGIVYAVLAFNEPFGALLLFRMIFLAILILIAVIDLEHRLILFVVIVPSCLLAIVKSVIVPAPPPDLRDALFGGAAGFGIFFIMFLGGVFFSAVVAHLRGYELPEIAFGFGDVMLGTLSGLLLGWQAFLFALMLTVFLGALGALIYLAARTLFRGGYALFTALPYGQYIVISTAIMMLWRDEVRALLTR